ncbi:Hypothetical predicted protein [Octopus vulgaris]|uniref:Uncharacterized protein n=1 Tax=Octopus vulgaris TaxID=6645 RepID=A0AA36AX66_OCTVU|nr:Hypothetical predicted protein [Octopus vulgaris]
MYYPGGQIVSSKLTKSFDPLKAVWEENTQDASSNHIAVCLYMTCSEQRLFLGEAHRMKTNKCLRNDVIT